MLDEIGKNKPNRRERHQNKQALAKKERAKQKNINQRRINDELILDWDDVTNEEEKKFQKGYIAGVKGSIVKVLNKSEEKIFESKINKNISEKLLKLLVVGDIVYYENKNGQFVIEKRGKRNNYLSRTRADSSRFGSEEEQIIAANIDVAIIVAPIKNPDFNHKLVDRYLVLCQNGGVIPVICLNKVDLTDERNPIIDHYKSLGIKVLETSIVTGIGMDELRDLLINKVAVVLGKSGVGKSSIINALNSEMGLKTQNVNQKSGEGKHTTTSSDLYKRNTSSYIVDTPGIRALGVDQIPKNELKDNFPEFLDYKGMCKYDNCLHDSEPSCAIKIAVKEGKIKKERYDSYIRMLRDLV